MADRLRHLIFLGAGLLAAVAGDELRAQDAAKETAVFTVYAPVDSPVLKTLFYANGPADRVKLVFRGNSRSAPVKVATPAKPLVFVREQIDPVTQKAVYVPVAEVTWPEVKTKKALLVFATGGAPETVKVLAVDDGPEVFPLRTMRVFNATGRTLFAKIAAFEGEIPAGLSAPHAYPVSGDDPTQVGSFPVAFAINDAQAGAQLLHSGYGEAWPAGRSLVFVLPPKEPGAAIQLRTLVDAPPPPKK